jgi:hypothetical protein
MFYANSSGAETRGTKAADWLQRRHRVPSDTLVYDLQFRLRCTYCNCRRGFRITILDARTRWDNSKPRLERVAAINDSDLGRRCHKKAATGDAAQ